MACHMVPDFIFLVKQFEFNWLATIVKFWDEEVMINSLVQLYLFLEQH